MKKLRRPLLSKSAWARMVSGTTDKKTGKTKTRFF